MLDDFLEANGLKAELLVPKRPLRTAHDIPRSLGVEAANVAQCVLALVGTAKRAEHNEAILIVLPLAKKFGEEELHELLGASIGVRFATEHETEDLTGYPAEFVPVVSVYGVRTLIDAELMKKEFIYCAGGEAEHVLKITPAELKENTEGIEEIDA
ncbi:MAG: YbaK/EbsC family protein [Candidatus Diapherotrites archaeon]